jgi:mono/diheme cytochrome c family protein
VTRRPFVALFVALAGCQAEPPPVAFDGAEAREAAAQVAHGKRIADVLGCTGCHGANLQGERFYELYASNLTRDLRGYSNAEIERVLRHGVPKDGRDLWGMPSEIFQHLSAPDMAALIAYLRSLKPGGGPTQPPLPFPKEVRDLIAKGEIKPAAAFVRDSKALAPVDLGRQHALGRYVTRVTCAECHGPELKGNQRDTPDLIVAGAYNREEFEKLITQGVPSGGRKLRNELMPAVARERFSKMTRDERDALYAYLKARAEQPQ